MINQKMKTILFLDILFLSVLILPFLNQIGVNFELISNRFEIEENNNIEIRLKNSGYWELSPLVIDDIGSGDYTWVEANAQPWCSGLGTWSDPYIIENVTINGFNSSSCIEIRNSDVYFIIRNCTFYNSSTNFNEAGIKLNLTYNGTIMDNNCSFNNGQGIYLLNSQNNTISGNIANYNGYHGILLWTSQNNTISENLLYENDDQGIHFQINCDQNIISKNKIIKNKNLGIYFYQFCDDNIISENIINNQTNHGILMNESDRNTILRNIVYWNGGNGIFLDNSLSSSDDSLIYNNIFVGNGGNAVDNGVNNDWNNTVIGNYWDNFGGVDSDNDGICDSSYDVPPVGGSQDYLPIYENPLFNGSAIHIDNTGISGHKWVWASTRWWCSGSGTFEDPYKIKDLIINGYNSSDCILIGNSSAYFIIENCTLYNASYGNYNAGIKLMYTNNGTIIRNNCSFNNDNGIYFYWCVNNTILGNYIFNNSETGIYLDACENITVLSNMVNNTKLHNGIRTYYCNYINLTGNTVMLGGENGILIRNGKNMTITNNIAKDNGQDGVMLYFPDNCIVSNNNLTNNRRGVFLYQECDFNTISENNVSNNREYGIALYNSDNNTVFGNIANNNNESGILIDLECNNNTIYDNIANFNNKYGIYLSECSQINVTANIANNNNIYGIFLFSSNNSIILGNIFNENLIKPYIETNCLNNNFLWNVLDKYTDPIHIDDLGSGDFNWSEAKSLLAWCSGSGDSANPYFFENIIINGQFSSNCIEIENSNKFFIIRNCTTLNSSFGGWSAGIKLLNTNNGKLINNNCSKNGDIGILIENSHNNTISENLLSNNDQGGVLARWSNNNTFIENTIYNNSGRGFYLETNCINNTISGNIIYNNTSDGILLLQSYYNNFTGNNLDYNFGHNIYLVNSDNNMFIGNNITNSPNIGLFMDGPSDNNTVYKNYFIGNGLHAKDDGSKNEWNNTDIGNYWDNYTGVDKNDDGIGDTPYYIDGLAKSQDNFPICDDGPESPIDNGLEPPFDIMLIIIVISIIIGVVALIGVILLKRKKSIKEMISNANIKITPSSQPAEEVLRALKVKPRKDLLKTIEKPIIPKKLKEGDETSPAQIALSAEEIEELKKTESEVGIEEKEFICVVHKGNIDGNIYLCPQCKTLYCERCAKALREKGEKCWSCGNEININVLDQFLPEVRQKIQQVEARIASLKTTAQNLDENFYVGDINQEEYFKMKSSLAEKIGTLMNEIDRLKENN